jgi:hypothetical protein
MYFSIGVLTFQPYILNGSLRLIWQNSERDRDRTGVTTHEPATFATYHITQKRWVRSEPRLGPFKSPPGISLGRGQRTRWCMIMSTNCFICEAYCSGCLSVADGETRFGGNSGEDGLPRLNDLWSMRLVRRVPLAFKLNSNLSFKIGRR